jgi:signal transduction histidine kinase
MIDVVIVFFVYGLAFFCLGLAMALEAGRSPSLAEAQILRPLAVFGLLHGTHEWLEIFILQAQYFDVDIPFSWLWIRLGLLVISFVSLVAFGVQALRPPKRLLAMDISIGGGLLALYIALFLLIGAFFWQDINAWIGRADVLARYILAVPGAILASMALRRQADQARVAGRESLTGSLTWGAIGFMFYAISQVFVTPIEMFPANIVNGAVFLSVFHIPIQVFRAGFAILITISLIRATQIVEQERQIELLDAKQAHLNALQQVQDELIKREALRKELLRHTVNAQEEERKRIARELHDETSQVLTGFTLDLATLRNYLPLEDHVQKIFSRLQDLSRQMSQGIYRLVHDLRPAQLDELGLVPALEYLADDFSRRMGLSVEININGIPKRLESAVETVCFRVVQEALTNTIRHAQTNHAQIDMLFEEDEVTLSIQDDGVGFDYEIYKSDPIGWGIAGMRERVRNLDGSIRLDSQKGMGTRIEFTIPIKEWNLSPNEDEIL